MSEFKSANRDNNTYELSAKEIINNENFFKTLNLDDEDEQWTKNYWECQFKVKIKINRVF